MAIVYSEKIIEIAVIQEYEGRPVVNVWHMWFDSELGSDTKEAVVRDFANNWQDHVLDLQTSLVSVLRFDWRSLDPGDATLGSLEPDPAKPSTGAGTTTAMPPNVALLVNKRTEDRPRGRRDGRAFIAGVMESHVDPRGRVVEPQFTALQDALDLFYNGISDTSGAASGDRYPAVLETTADSRAPGQQSVVIGSRRVTSLVLDPLCSTQRDRLR